MPLQTSAEFIALCRSQVALLTCGLGASLSAVYLTEELVEEAEATLKRFRRRGGMIALEAANPAYETRILPDHLVKVQGRLVGLIRSY